MTASQGLIDFRATKSGCGVTWGTYASVELEGGRFFWCSWKNFNTRKIPISYGLADNRRDADILAMGACRTDKCSGLQDVHARKYTGLIHGIEPKGKPYTKPARRPFKVS